MFGMKVWIRDTLRQLRAERPARTGLGARTMGATLAMLMAVGVLMSGVGPAAAAPGDYTVELTGPASVPVGQAFTYTATVEAEASAGDPAKGIVLTAQLPPGVAFASVPTDDSSPVASADWNAATRQVTFTMKDLDEPLSTFVFAVTQVNNAEKDSTTVFQASLTGTAGPGGTPAPASASTTVTGAFDYSAVKRHSVLAGSNNRIVTYSFSIATVSPQNPAFTTWAQRLTDKLPAGVEILASSTGFGSWVATGDQATGQTMTWTRDGTYGPSSGWIDNTFERIWFTVHYPEPPFTTGTTPPVNRVDLEVRDYSGTWFDGNFATTRAPQLGPGDNAPAIGALKDANDSAANTADAFDGSWANHRVKGAFIDPQGGRGANLVITDSSDHSAKNTDFWGHTEVYRVHSKFNPALAGANVPYTFEYQTSAGAAWKTLTGGRTTGTPLLLQVQTDGSTRYTPSGSWTANATLNLPAGEVLTGWRITVAGSGTGATIPSGSEANILTTYLPVFESWRDQSANPATPRTNTATVTGQLADGTVLAPASDDATVYFQNQVAIVTTVTPPGTVQVGQNANYIANIANMNPQRAYSDATMRVVLPKGVFYDSTVGATPYAAAVTGTGQPVPRIGDGVTVTTESVVDDQGATRQVVVFTFDNLPAMRPLGQKSDAGVEGEGYRYNVPVTVLPQAYDAKDTAAPVNSYAYTQDPRFTAVPMGYYYAYYGPDTYDFDPNRVDVAVAKGSSTVTTAGGLQLGKLTRGAADRPWTLSDTVASPGTAQWQVHVSNALPEPVTNVVVFDRVPTTGDGRGSAFPVTLTGPLTGVPGGAVVEYSRNATTATDGTWDTNPVGATAWRISLPSMASGEGFDIELTTAIPAGLNYGPEAINNVTATGDYRGTPRSFVSNSAKVGPAALPSIALVKKTNGVEYDQAPGANVATGSTVVWTYEVTNTGNTALDSVAVNDAFTAGDGSTGTFAATSAAQGPLLPGETRTFTAQGTAIKGQYTNTATATANAIDAQGNVLATPVDPATDQSWYRAATSGLTIAKTTNEETVASAPGLQLTPGEKVTWHYTVTNSGDSDLTNVKVTDVDSTGAVVYTHTIASLPAGESVVLKAEGTAISGQYHNTVTAQATDPVGGPDLTAAADSYYFGYESGFTMSKEVATSVNGPWHKSVTIDSGSTAYWRIQITNTGNHALTDITVKDPELGELAPVAFLAAGQTHTIVVAQHDVKKGYTNVATVAVTYPGGEKVDKKDEAKVVVNDAAVVNPETQAKPLVTWLPPWLPLTGAQVGGVLALALLAAAAGTTIVVLRRRAQHQ